MSAVRQAKDSQRWGIRQYIRRNNKIVGLMIAAKNADGDIVIDYSLCSSKDRFDKSLAEKIAMGRVFTTNSKSQLKRILPPSILQDYTEFVARCERYFKKSREDMVGFIQ